MDIEEFTEYVEKINERIHEILKDDEEALDFYSRLVVSLNATCEENKRQKEIIDEAINCIENKFDYFDDGILSKEDGTTFEYVMKVDVDYLLEILKGVSK